ncbi:response regulator [Agarivorans gilvus]|jgi:two-component system chemotaxis response regulator CheY|uniref:Response regulator n=1 Tax=Agarivorans gilvus TaxID=680279 RepID=A0ABQ1HWB6_9ALTE|nr:response regulator [Agarivorans gilvus]GGA92423.1 response regulator [Agarivorans gilvus]
MEALSLADLTILLVEPSNMQRNIIRTRLHEAGIDNFVMAENCQQAVELAIKTAPDLVVSSMYFADGTATDLVQQLRANDLSRDIAFMLISSEACHHTLDAIKQAGVIAILPKPFEFTHLLGALQATISYIEPDQDLISEINVASKKILVVDDSLTARRHIARVLENIGVAQVLFAENGQQALNLLEQDEVDLVITDYNMPVMDGAALIEALRQHPRFSDIPALMVTSENNGAKLDGVRQSGVSALVDKPFDIDAVKQVLGRLFEQAA